jgi:hypothetical protein
MGRKHGCAKPVNAAGEVINELCVLRQPADLAAQFLDTGTGLV